MPVILYQQELILQLSRKQFRQEQQFQPAYLRLIASRPFRAMAFFRKTSQFFLIFLEIIE
jgi:hypothetical protein